MLTVLKIQVGRRNGIRIIRLTGPLDSTTHKEFKSLMDPLVDTPGMRIVLDCENLTYAGSTEILLLGQYHHRMAQNQGGLGIAALNNRITQTLEQIGLGQMLHLYPTIEAALVAMPSS